MIGLATAQGRRVAGREQPDIFSWIVLTLSVAAVWLLWTPSSYGYVLGALGEPRAGLIAGKSRPIRSDEWAVWTPFIQIAVLNGFERFNALSPYGEDLRNFNGLPLWDWALPFKPQFWAFFVFGPARAFAIHHVMIVAAFLIGYRHLLRRFGFGAGFAALGSLLLFFTSYAQLWWTTTGHLLAVFPWIMLVATATGMHPMLRAGLLAWLTAVLLIGHLYPPIVISLGFAGAVLILAFRPQDFAWRRLAVTVAALAIGAALAGIYLWDAISEMATTVYPGRRISGGGEMPSTLWLAQFFPFLVSTDAFTDLLGLNICEVATGGSYLMLLALVFVDHRRLLEALREEGPADRDLRRALLVIALGFAAISVWMLAPLAPHWGRILLWDRVPGARMMFAAGLLLQVATLLALRAAGVVLTWQRFVVMALLVVVAWLAAKTSHGLGQSMMDLLVLAPLAAVAARSMWGKFTHAGATLAIVATALVANVAGFGRFNPIQRADTLFREPRGVGAERIVAIAGEHPDNWVVETSRVPGAAVAGAVLNGLGFRSVAHVVMRPQLAFFRTRFSNMDAAAFDQVFNRYAHIHVVPGLEQPRTPQPDVIQIPPEPFLDRQDRYRQAEVGTAADRP